MAHGRIIAPGGRGGTFSAGGRNSCPAEGSSIKEEGDHCPAVARSPFRDGPSA
jgi:hypothetical protein